MSKEYSITAPDDGEVVIYNPEGRWTNYALRETYTGTTGKGKYVPKIRDWVTDDDTGEVYRTVDVDLTTLIPRLVKIKNPNIGPDVTDEDLLIGVGPGTYADTYLAYLDKSTRPYTLAVDQRLYTKGPDATKAVIYRGSTTDGTWHPISCVFDANNTLISNELQLVLTKSSDVTNYNERAVPVCYTTDDMPDNEVITVYFYSDNGLLVSKRQLLVMNTAFIRRPDESLRYVTHVELRTPFLSSSDPHRVNYPINVPVRGFNMLGVVHYSDGTELELPVDNRRFSIMGLSDFVATVPNQEIPVILKYTLAADEQAIDAGENDGEFFKTAVYTFVTQRAEGAYVVKLYGYPRWLQDSARYTIDWFLGNMERGMIYDVSPYVRFNENSPPFLPDSYGVAQRLSVSLDLAKINGTYKSYMHTQVIDVVLRRPGSDRLGTRWEVGFEPGQNPMYGRDNVVMMQDINANLKILNMRMGEKTLDSWLDRIFYLTKPVYDPSEEARAPIPNMFNLIINGTKFEYSISNWGDDLTYNGSLKDADNVYVEFFKRTPESDVMLGISGIPVQTV